MSDARYTTDTSGDPERHAIEYDERLDVAYVYENTGHGWRFLADYDGLSKAQQRVSEWEEELAGEIRG